MGNNKGFVGSLFDLSFESFVTEKLIRLLYVLALVGVVIGAAATLMGGAAGDSLLTGIVGALFVLLFGTLLARVYAEILIVLFRIADNTAVMAHAAVRDVPDAPPAAPTPAITSSEPPPAFTSES